ncbi:MAG: hypothetical protein HY646_14145 [Acidobacteria bacterium]|nr:hypothetical protein [Acidobacteriota bacterium]
MDRFDAEIRKTYRIHVPPASSCVDAETLEAFYSDRLPAHKMEEVRSHLSTCPNCLELARDYCVFQGISPVSDDAVPPGDIPVENGSSRPWFSRPLVQAAAGILLAIAAGVIWTTAGRVPPAADRTPAMRGSDSGVEMRLISPQGTLPEAPRVLEWEPNQPANYYEVEIQDARFFTVWRSPHVKDTRIPLPDEVVNRIQDGSYAWRVIATIPGGQPVVSPFATFEVRSR